MKLLKGILGGMICCICCLLHSVSVRADLIWEPEDSFYQKHASECTYVNRQFTANGPDGKVIVYQSPELPIVVETWENGNQEWISYTYRDSDGIVWGYCRGWMPMAYMEVVYDCISFEEEYADQIKGQSGELGAEYLGQEVYCWEYPGAESGYPVSTGHDYTPGYNGVFTDEEGHSWGKVGYYFGRRNFWVCIDQPDADYEQLYPDGGPQRGNTDRIQGMDGTADPGESGTGRIVPKMKGRTVTVAAVMVVLVAAVTALLLIGLRKGRKKQ